MILHTCPHCSGSSLYPPDRGGSVNCQSCGKAFELSAFTKAQPNSAIRIGRAGRMLVRRGARSNIVVYSCAGLAALVVIWIAVSLFGLLPDEYRLVNRRFVTLADWERVQESVGLLAVGMPTGDGGISFFGFGTAWSVSNDGFMLTSKHVLDGVPEIAGAPRIWVYLNHERLEAEIVSVDSVADLAIIKVERRLPYRFRFARDKGIAELNADVVAVGFQSVSVQVDSAVMDTPLARTQGSISRVLTDNVGTHWIEHTAPIKDGSSGGPLIKDGIVIGINSGGEPGIYRALAVAPLSEKIQSRIADWRRASQKDEE